MFDLLIYLMQNRDRVVSKDDLIASVWGGRIVSDSTLATRINAARKAIGDSGEAQRLISTMARKGFRFTGTVTEHVKSGRRPPRLRRPRSRSRRFTSAPPRTACASPMRRPGKARRWSRPPTGSTISNTTGTVRSGATCCTRSRRSASSSAMTNAATACRIGTSTTFRSKPSCAISKPSSMPRASKRFSLFGISQGARCRSPMRCATPSASSG